MTALEIEDYFDAIQWFTERYQTENTGEVIRTMYISWPNMTTLLLNQGFFMAIDLRN